MAPRRPRRPLGKAGMTSTLDQRVPGALQLTQQQRRRFDEDGFFLVDNALTPAEIEQLIAVTDTFADAARRTRELPAHAPVRVNNIVARHPAFRNLLDHPVILP